MFRISRSEVIFFHSFTKYLSLPANVLWGLIFGEIILFFFFLSTGVREVLIPLMTLGCVLPLLAFPLLSTPRTKRPTLGPPPNDVVGGAV